MPTKKYVRKNRYVIKIWVQSISKVNDDRTAVARLKGKVLRIIKTRNVYKVGINTMIKEQKLKRFIKYPKIYM